VWVVIDQKRQLTSLRAELEQSLTKPIPDGQVMATPGPVRPDKSQAATENPALSSELLRLRSEVTRLTARKRELAAAAAENQSLRDQLATTRTNAPTPISVTPGYLRKAEAQMVGYSTAENTLQSFLWAVQNQDFTNLVRALTPASAQKLQENFQQSKEAPEAFFKNADKFPGLKIQKRESLPDGTIQLEVEIAPGQPTEKIRLESIDGEWKMALPF
jgi:hypothetical protein